MMNPIRQLCLVLDLDCKRVLPLITMESEKLDQYVFENFEDSSAVRKCFQKQIQDYLSKNASYLENIYKNIGRRTEGSIVILELNGGYNQRKSVLYKKRVKEIENFLTIPSKSKALMKEDFIKYLLKQPNFNLFLSNYEIDILNKEYKYFSKTKKQEFIYLLFQDLKKRCFQNTDRIRDFYSLLKKYKQIKPVIETLPLKEEIVKVENKAEDIDEEIDPDKMYLDTPTIFPVYDDILEEVQEPQGHSLKYMYKPYHRR